MPNKEALEQLYRVVKDAPEDLFHMRAVVEIASCGTARCALGWCLVDPWFIENTKLGRFKYWGPDDEGSFYSTEALARKAEKVFGICKDDADNLFAMNMSRGVGPHAVSRDEVLANIDILLDGGQTFEYDAVFQDDEED